MYSVIEHLNKKEPIKFYNSELYEIGLVRECCKFIPQDCHDDFAGFRTVQGGKTFEVNLNGEAREVKISKGTSI